MPKILEMKVVDDELWVRIPSVVGENSVTLWTEAEKERVLGAERRRCVYTIERLGKGDGCF
jgi:hypothetical protein